MPLIDAARKQVVVVDQEDKGGKFDVMEVVPAFIAARRARVSKQLFAYWVRSGKIAPCGEGLDGRPVYLTYDALKVECATRLSPLSSRSKGRQLV